MRTAAVVAVLLGVVLAAIWLGRSPEPAVAARPAVELGEPEPAAEEQALARPRAPSPPQAPAIERDAPSVEARPATADARQAVEPAPATRVTVRVVSLGAGAAVADAPVFVAQVPWKVGAKWTEVERSSGEQDEVLLTDGEGRATFRVTPGIRYEATAEFQDDRAEDGSLLVEPLAEGEVREVTLEIRTGADLLFHGLVVGSDEAPLAGAEVALSDGQRIYTGLDGRFQVMTQHWVRTWGRVTAEDWGMWMFAVTDGHQSLDSELVIELPRSTTLRVGVLGADGVPVRVVCTAEPSAVFLTDDRPRGAPDVDASWIGEATESGALAWVGVTDSFGWCTVRGLPPDAPLAIELQVGGVRQRSLTTPVVLAPAEERELVVPLRVSGRILGTLVEAGGRVLPGEEVWLVRGESDARLLRPEDRPWAWATITDGTGRFAFEELEPGAWRVGPAPPSIGDGIVREDRVAPLAERVKLVGIDDVRDVTLIAHRGLYLRGEVLDPQGEPVTEGAFLSAVDSEDALRVDGEVGTDGRFALGPLVAGSYELRVRLSVGRFQAPQPITAPAGTTGLVVRLEEGATLRGRLLHGETGASVDGTVVVTGPSMGDDVPWLWGGMTTDGTFEAHGLGSGHHTVSALTPDGLVGLAELELARTDELVEVSLAMGRGGTLQVLSLLDENPVFVRVHRGEALVNGQMLERGRTWETPVPPGVLRVVLLAGEQVSVQTVTVEAGEVAEVVFRAE